MRSREDLEAEVAALRNTLRNNESRINVQNAELHHLRERLERSEAIVDYLIKRKVK